MGMNLYLIYLATILSASGFNTYNYISNRVRQIKIKKRQMKFKKNLSFKTKTVSSIGDTVPSIVYFGSTLLSLIPIVNLCIPEFSKNLYYGLGVDDALDGFYRMLNEAETTKRYSNGLSLKIMEECGYNMPDELKKIEVDKSKINLSSELKEKLNEQVKSFYDTIYPEKEKVGTIDDIIPLSDREFEKRKRKSLRLTYEEDLDLDKINKIERM